MKRTLWGLLLPVIWCRIVAEIAAIVRRERDRDWEGVVRQAIAQPIDLDGFPVLKWTVPGPVTPEALAELIVYERTTNETNLRMLRNRGARI